MKVNYRRTIEKQRQAEWDQRQKEREEMLSKMTPEERKQYLADEKERVQGALNLMGTIGSVLGDSPYSKL